MFGGLKFIPREQIDKEDENKKKKKSSSRYSSSDEELGRVKKSSRKKKWYSSEESESGESGSESEESETRSTRRGKGKRDRRRREKKRGREDGSEIDKSDDGREKKLKEKETVRKGMGLEWMLKPGEKMEKKPIEIEPVESKDEEPKVNPRELNPYFKDNGSGYPEEEQEGSRGSKLLGSSVVGDGGASWRLKALKRAKEQAARDGREIESVVGERWGSLGNLAVSVSSHRAAPARAHLHAIHSRKRRDPEEIQMGGSGSQHRKDSDKDNQSPPKRDYLKDISVKVPKMMEPKARDSLSWSKRKGQPSSSSTLDAGLISDTVSRLNKFAGDGSFMQEVLKSQSAKAPRNSSPVRNSNQSEKLETSFSIDPSMSANQLAAKALQLRLKGKTEEAEKLMQEVEKIRAKQDSNSNADVARPPRKEESSNRYAKQDTFRKKRNEDDGDLNLAQNITQNKKFSLLGQADDEYDYDGDAPTKKSAARKKREQASASQPNRFASTKQQDCALCYDNPKRPAHLVVSVGNFTYLMLPQSEPVVPGHCCIVPMQHVQASRSVDEYVWEEIRNFKKCLIMMFAKQDKQVVFLETAMGLTKQRRHCMIECIPMPQEIAEEAPHYFKMEIEEAESEWSQHNAKKLIDTGTKGLRKSIPENIPYFHVEFGLSKGFLHPIDDEGEFSHDFGMNIARGVLKVPEEDMYRRRRRRYESPEEQKLAVRSFATEWASFDWTKQLDG